MTNYHVRIIIGYFIDVIIGMDQAENLTDTLYFIDTSPRGPFGGMDAFRRTPLDLTLGVC